MCSSILNQCRGLSTAAMCSVLGFPLEPEHGSFAVGLAGDKIFVYVIRLGIVSYIISKK